MAEPNPDSTCSFCRHIAVGAHDQCVICGFDGHAGLGYWAVHCDEDATPVCTGKCWRTYEARKKEAKAESDLIAALTRWGSL